MGAKVVFRVVVIDDGPDIKEEGPRLTLEPLLRRRRGLRTLLLAPVIYK